MTLRQRLGCLLAIAYPLVEIVVAAHVARVVGWWWVLVYVVACLVVGLGLVRFALGATGRGFGLAMADLRAPGQSAPLAIAAVSEGPRTPPAQTLLIVPAGLLIAVPGIVTTVIGLILWIPAVRARIAARLERAARRWNPPGPAA